MSLVSISGLVITSPVYWARNLKSSYTSSRHSSPLHLSGPRSSVATSLPCSSHTLAAVWLEIA